MDDKKKRKLYTNAKKHRFKDLFKKENHKKYIK